MPFGIVLAAAIVVAIAMYFVRHHDPAKRGRFLKRSGFTVMALSTLFFGAFVIGDTFADPGGWKAGGLVAAMVAPLAGLCALAWFRPGRSVPVFAVLTAAVIGVSIWFAASPGWWRSFENRNGPIRDIVTFILAAGIAVLGLKRTTVAGALLLAVGILPVTISSLGSLSGFNSLAVVSSAPVVAGLLYLLSARAPGRPARPAETETGPGELPKAA